MHDFQSNRIVNASNESQEKKKQEEKILYKASMHKRAYQNHYKIIEMRYTIKSRKESQICTHKHTHTSIKLPKGNYKANIYTQKWGKTKELKSYSRKHKRMKLGGAILTSNNKE